MTDLWCIKGNLNDGELFLQADSVEIAPHGERAFYRENGSRSLVLALAPGAWTCCFATLRALLILSAAVADRRRSRMLRRNWRLIGTLSKRWRSNTCRRSLPVRARRVR